MDDLIRKPSVSVNVANMNQRNLKLACIRNCLAVNWKKSRATVGYDGRRKIAGYFRFGDK